MLRSYKYRIYPTAKQEELINKTLGACRFVYNLALETKIAAFQSGIYLTGYDLIKQLPGLKQDLEWLKEVDSQAVQNCIINLDLAYRNFFKGGGFPKFKSKRGIQSFTCPNNARRVNWELKTITVPKIKGIPARLTRSFSGLINRITITRTATGKYFASVLVDNGTALPVKTHVQKSKGIDLGLNHFIITDDGIKIGNPKYLREAMARMKVLQRRASKKKKGSNNRKKAHLRIAVLHEKIRNKRLDFIHKVTSGLVSDNQTDTFVMEDLNVKGMQSNHRLAQSITDVSWSEFKRQMQYKCDWFGKNLIVINRFYPSSKTCSNCGNVKRELRLSEREYCCKICGNVMDRDVNAAINIRNNGLKEYSGVGIPGVPVELCSMEQSVKQEETLKVFKSRFLKEWNGKNL